MFMNMLHENFHHLLHSFNQPLLSQQNLELYTHAVHDKGAALRNCWGFVDRTVRTICRPNRRIQRILYNGLKSTCSQTSICCSTQRANSQPLQVQWKEGGMTVECWLSQAYCLYFNTTAIGLMALLFVYMVT